VWTQGETKEEKAAVSAVKERGVTFAKSAGTSKFEEIVSAFTPRLYPGARYRGGRINHGSGNRKEGPVEVAQPR